MLGALIHCWVQLAGVLGGEKTYLGSSIIIKIYPTLSLAIGGRDGMDGGGHWMTHSNYRTRHQASPGASLLLGANGGGFGRGKIVFRIYYNYQNLSRPFRHRWGAGGDGLQQAPLDDVL